MSYVKEYFEKAKLGYLYFVKHFIKFPAYIISHPIDGFYEMKYGKKGLLRVATVFIIIRSLLGILQYKYTGFLFNDFNPNQFDFIKQILLTLTPLLLIIFANWTITTLMDGKGKLKDIYMLLGYALFPELVLKLVNIPLSHYYSLNEAFFYNFVNQMAYIIFLCLLFIGFLVVHEYTVLRTFVTVLLTLVSMAVLMFIGILSFSLIQQIYLFLHTILKEIILRS